MGAEHSCCGRLVQHRRQYQEEYDADLQSWRNFIGVEQDDDAPECVYLPLSDVCCAQTFLRSGSVTGSAPVSQAGRVNLNAPSVRGTKSSNNDPLSLACGCLTACGPLACSTVGQCLISRTHVPGPAGRVARQQTRSAEQAAARSHRIASFKPSTLMVRVDCLLFGTLLVTLTLNRVEESHDFLLPA